MNLLFPISEMSVVMAFTPNGVALTAKPVPAHLLDPMRLGKDEMETSDSKRVEGLFPRHP